VNNRRNSCSWSGLFHVLIFTGLRPGEAFGLQWRDLDLPNATFVVRRTVTRGADGEAVIGEPKTARSRRTVNLPDSLVKRLEQRRYRFNPRKVSEQVFPKADGGLYLPDHFPRSHFKSLLERATRARPRCYKPRSTRRS
jgi:integrase